MLKQVARSSKNAKSGQFRNRNQNSRIRNQISPVMQKVRDLLPANKAAHHLHILTDQPLGNCQKMLCGERDENPEMITALLRSPIGKEVLLAMMGDARPEWFTRYQKQLDVARVRRVLRDLEQQAAE